MFMLHKHSAMLKDLTKIRKELKAFKSNLAVQSEMAGGDNKSGDGNKSGKGGIVVEGGNGNNNKSEDEVGQEASDDGHRLHQ